MSFPPQPPVGFLKILRRECSITFSKLNSKLTHAVQALQLSVSVERWGREDEADREEDRESMMAFLVEMEQKRQGNDAAIMNTLNVRTK